MNCASPPAPATSAPALHDHRGGLPEPALQRQAPAGAFRPYRLWVTEADGELTPHSCCLIAMVVSLGLSGQVRISHEPPEVNLAFLRSCVDPAVGGPQPYLEQVVGGCSASVVHYLGQELVEQLRSLDSGPAARRAVLAS
ncbi:MAG: hypothetical protein EPO12_19365 [Aquabacterium sp.]|nr:MAG: hypothetical protein EPO12_19365 [Aquabacterium sp.]